jgi:hypothetical protein
MLSRRGLSDGTCSPVTVTFTPIGNVRDPAKAMLARHAERLSGEVAQLRREARLWRVIVFLQAAVLAAATTVRLVWG